MSGYHYFSDSKEVNPELQKSVNSYGVPHNRFNKRHT